MSCRVPVEMLPGAGGAGVPGCCRVHPGSVGGGRSVGGQDVNRDRGGAWGGESPQVLARGPKTFARPHRWGGGAWVKKFCKAHRRVFGALLRGGALMVRKKNFALRR